MSNPGTTNLVSYWSMEEASGTRSDSHGTNDLTDNNTVTQGTGIQSNGADFEASNSEYLSVADNSSISITGDLSVSMWIYRESATNMGLIGKVLYPNREYQLRINDGSNLLQLWMSSNGSSQTKKQVSWSPLTSTWYHVGFTYNASAGEVKFYIDGSQQGSTQTGMPTNLYNGSAELRIGHIEAGDYMDGIIDEVALYSRTLTSSEMNWLYNSGSGRSYSDISGGAATPAPAPKVTFF